MFMCARWMFTVHRLFMEFIWYNWKSFYFDIITYENYIYIENKMTFNRFPNELKICQRQQSTASNKNNNFSMHRILYTRIPRKNCSKIGGKQRIVFLILLPAIFKSYLEPLCATWSTVPFKVAVKKFGAKKCTIIAIFLR